MGLQVWEYLCFLWQESGRNISSGSLQNRKRCGIFHTFYDKWLNSSRNTKNCSLFFFTLCMSWVQDLFIAYCGLFFDFRYLRWKIAYFFFSILTAPLNLNLSVLTQWSLDYWVLHGKGTRYTGDRLDYLLYYLPSYSPLDSGQICGQYRQYGQDSPGQHSEVRECIKVNTMIKMVVCHKFTYTHMV